MPTETYTDPQAREWLSKGLCPECGLFGNRHDGWGGPDGCQLTDYGVAARLAEYRRQHRAEVDGEGHSRVGYSAPYVIIDETQQFRP